MSSVMSLAAPAMTPPNNKPACTPREVLDPHRRFLCGLVRRPSTRTAAPTRRPVFFMRAPRSLRLPATAAARRSRVPPCCPLGGARALGTAPPRSSGPSSKPRPIPHGHRAALVVEWRVQELELGRVIGAQPVRRRAAKKARDAIATIRGCARARALRTARWPRPVAAS